MRRRKDNMQWRNGLWCRFVAVVLALMLMLSVLAACGGGGEEDEPFTSSPTSTATVVPTAIHAPTATATATPVVTPTPTSGEPVKIGAICSWSGPAAMSGTYYADNIIKLVEKQVKDMGGILGGREINVSK